ncbi:hypothetical protein IAT38_007656 [Cryptococcus sp. DSM 104549]
MTRLLLTGGSGYIGGEILAQLQDRPIPALDAVYVTVRKPEHAEAVRKLGYEPVTLDLGDAAAIKAFVVDSKINVVLELTNALNAKIALPAIEGLAELGSGKTYISTSGAKMFSAFAGYDTTKPVEDDSPSLVADFKDRDTPLPMAQAVSNEYAKIFEAGKKAGVAVHIVVPPMVYGKSRTFGNPISIQIVALVKIALATSHLYRLPPSITFTGSLPQTWALCHVADVASGYRVLLENVLEGKAPEGVYFTENGTFAWEQLSDGILKALGLEQGVVGATELDVERIAEALKIDKGMVALQTGGRANLKGNRLRSLGWTPKYDKAHLLGEVEGEARFIAQHLQSA